MVLQLAGLLALLLFRRPSLPGWKVAWSDAWKKRPDVDREQDYSYGDSSGFAPDSLLMRAPVRGRCNQMRCKPTVMDGILQMGKEDVGRYGSVDKTKIRHNKGKDKA